MKLVSGLWFSLWVLPMLTLTAAVILGLPLLVLMLVGLKALALLLMGLIGLMLVGLSIWLIDGLFRCRYYTWVAASYCAQLSPLILGLGLAVLCFNLPFTFIGFVSLLILFLLVALSLSIARYWGGEHVRLQYQVES